MNPYEILGIDKSASEKEIKKAYRDLCKTHHPDTGGDAEKFKEINSAYEVLSDADKKQKYDMYGDPKGNPYGNPFGRSPFDDGVFGGFGDFIAQHFGFGKDQMQRKGSDETIVIKLTLAEIMTGVNKKITYNRNTKCDGCKGEGGESSTKCGNCDGTGVVTTIYQTPIGATHRRSKCPNCNDGFIVKNPCKKCKGAAVCRHTETTTIVIPAGIPADMPFSIDGAGNEIRNGITGNLQIRIEEIPDATFVRNGSNLQADINISISEAVLGTQRDIKTPTSQFKIAIEPGCESGKIYDFKGKGIPVLGNDGRHYGIGNLYIRVNVSIPKNISKEYKKALEELKKYE